MSDGELGSLRHEVSMLRVEVAKLRSRVDHVGDALKSEARNTTKHFKAIYQYIADIHDYLTPMLHKVFPNYTSAKKQIDHFVEEHFSLPDSDTKDTM